MNLRVRQATQPQGTLAVSGDKSITHRAFILSALAEGRSIIHGYSDCADCWSTLEIMKSLGVDVRRNQKDILITGKGLKGLEEPSDILDCGNSGTTMRILAGVLSGQPFYSVLSGDHSLRKRPMARIIQPLTLMGAAILGRENGKYAPLAIRGNSLSAIDYQLPVASAQVKSSILLAGLFAKGETVVHEPSPARDHTERMLRLLGGYCHKNGQHVRVEPWPRLTAQEITIPGDISSAAYFLILGAIVPGSHIKLDRVGLNPTRTGILDVMRNMNAALRVSKQAEISGEPVGRLEIQHSSLVGMRISGSLIPRLIDEIPIIAVAATQASGITEVCDAGELRLKETDRLKAIVSELKKMGADIEQGNDGLTIAGPKRLLGARVRSYGDHRIAMSLTIAGLLAEGETIIQDAECIEISFPAFIQCLKRIFKREYLKIED